MQSVFVVQCEERGSGILPHQAYFPKPHRRRIAIVNSNPAHMYMATLVTKLAIKNKHNNIWTGTGAGRCDVRKDANPI